MSAPSAVGGGACLPTAAFFIALKLYAKADSAGGSPLAFCRIPLFSFLFSLFFCLPAVALREGGLPIHLSTHSPIHLYIIPHYFPPNPVFPGHNNNL